MNIDSHTYTSHLSLSFGKQFKTMQVDLGMNECVFTLDSGHGDTALTTYTTHALYSPQEHVGQPLALFL